jgi:hypothetical protein
MSRLNDFYQQAHADSVLQAELAAVSQGDVAGTLQKWRDCGSIGSKEPDMTQVVIDDTLIQKARSVTVLTKDEDIVRVALEEYILGGEARKEALELAGTMHWDPEFAGWDPADFA